jgi:hypothetical protein
MSADCQNCNRRTAAGTLGVHADRAPDRGCNHYRDFAAIAVPAMLRARRTGERGRRLSARSAHSTAPRAVTRRSAGKGGFRAASGDAALRLARRARRRSYHPDLSIDPADEERLHDHDGTSGRVGARPQDCNGAATITAYYTHRRPCVRLVSADFARSHLPRQVPSSSTPPVRGADGSADGSRRRRYDESVNVQTGSREQVPAVRHLQSRPRLRIQSVIASSIKTCHLRGPSDVPPGLSRPYDRCERGSRSIATKLIRLGHRR